MQTETMHHDGKEFKLYTFSVPMMHEDFHKAEELGLVYVNFDASGNDYWNYEMEFVRREDLPLYEDWKDGGWPY